MRAWIARSSHLALAACLLAGCAGTPKANRRRAELAIGGSLVGVIASSITMAAVPQGKPVLIPITITFGGLAIASAVAYGVYHSQVVDEPAGPPPKPNPAWEYTKKAQASCRNARLSAGYSICLRKTSMSIKLCPVSAHAVQTL